MKGMSSTTAARCLYYSRADRVKSRIELDSSAAHDAVECGMTHLSGHDRSQLLLLPEAVDDYVSPDNPVRFIDAFVDGLDLAAASFVHVEPNAPAINSAPYPVSRTRRYWIECKPA
jgi:hypothetical protein